MKILAFVDLHGNMQALKRLIDKAKKDNVDLIIAAGDLSIFGRDLKKILSELNKINKPVLVVFGNHESEQEMKKACFGFDNVNFIHKKSVEIGDCSFIGYGGGGFAVVDDKFEKIAGDLHAKIKGDEADDKWIKEKIEDDNEKYKDNRDNKKSKKVVLILHGPPHGTKVDKLNGGYAGNKSYTKFIKEKQPELVICGHLHEAAGKKDKIGKTLVSNPGFEGEVFEV